MTASFTGADADHIHISRNVVKNNYASWPDVLWDPGHFLQQIRGSSPRMTQRYRTGTKGPRISASRHSPYYRRRLRRSPPPASVVSMILFGGSVTACARLGKGAVLCGMAMASTKCCWN